MKGIFTVSYNITLDSKDFVFTVKTDIDEVKLRRVIFVGEVFEYFLEEGVVMQKGSFCFKIFWNIFIDKFTFRQKCAIFS